MSLVIYKCIAALIIFLVSVVTVIYPLQKKGFQHNEQIELAEALASGIFLGAAFFHLLPDSIRTFHHFYGTSVTYPIPELISIGGFLLLLFLERLSLLNLRFNSGKNAIPYILAVILIIHSLTEGAALGIETTLPETTLLFIAIIAHKGSESFALCITMLRHQLPLNQILTIVFFFALMTPLGIAFGNMLAFGKSGELAAAIFNAFAAGTFLYMSTLHHIHFHKHTEDQQGLIEFGTLTLGVLVMAAIAIWT